MAIKVVEIAPNVAWPHMVELKKRGPGLIAWAKEFREEVEAVLAKDGAVLIRGPKISNAEAFQSFISELWDAPLMSYENRSTPRNHIAKGVYTSTHYPPNETIPLHNENSYTNRWAMRIALCCLLPASEGGQTPICDSRKIYQAIDPDVRAEFEAKKVMYRRYYGAVDLPWQEVFNTDDPATVEAFCQENGINFEWLDNNELTTSQVCQASAVHPTTGDKVWFNQAHLYHISARPPEIRDSLLSTYGEARLPRNSYYGDGSVISDDVLEHIRQVYADNKVVFDWQMGDIAVLDNMLAAHGREPYQGNRKVVVGMARPFSLT